MNQIKYYPNGDVSEECINTENSIIKIIYYINHRINEVMHFSANQNNNGNQNSNKLHREDDKPAYMKFNLEGLLLIKIYYINGKCHRDNNKPAFLRYSYIESRHNILDTKKSRFIKEAKFFINGNFGRTDNEPTHLIYYSKSNQVEYAKYKSALYFTYSCFNHNLPINIIVDNNLLHSPTFIVENNDTNKITKPALIKYDKKGNVMLEIYYHKGKIHRYDGPAKIMYLSDGTIIEELRFINDKLVTTKNDWVKNWGKMFSSNLNFF